jgi:hypothetical protein
MHRKCHDPNKTVDHWWVWSMSSWKSSYFTATDQVYQMSLSLRKSCPCTISWKFYFDHWVRNDPECFFVIKLKEIIKQENQGKCKSFVTYKWVITLLYFMLDKEYVTLL